jgi:peptide-methionine (S)-S-oxide reductase
MMMSYVHHVHQRPLQFTQNLATTHQIAWFGMGCFWGAERLFWQQSGVYSTAVGYGAGHTINPTYPQVCAGSTNHVELVQVIYDPKVISYAKLLSLFWENHDPTQGNRQGGDIGTQYRSMIACVDEIQMNLAQASLQQVEQKLSMLGFPKVTTQIIEFKEVDFYLAEEYHQQYLSKNPNGYCGLKGTGLKCVF